jgi:ubiquinone/menaquinone biosynthesis C-methylase UbiE
MKWILRWLWRASPGIRRAFANKVSDAVVGEPRLAAKFYPYLPEQSSYQVKTDGRRSDPRADLEIPPQDLWWGYADRPESYLAAGKDYVVKMKKVLEDAGTPLQSYKRILDFGCGSGIMIRWLHENALSGEVWGVDISGAHMLWCQQHMSPPFKFATTTSFPHLPFEDGYFDFVYAGSVFTHIADLVEAWLMELRRIVRPGGRLYLTVHDEHTIDLFMKDTEHATGAMLRAHDREAHFTTAGYDFFTVNRTPGEGGAGQAQVFHHTDYLQRHWSRYLKIVSITPESYWYQSAVLLEK